MKRIIVLGVCLALSQFSFAEVVVNPDGTAKVSWGGQQGLDNAKKIMYQNPNVIYSGMTSSKTDTTSSNEDDYQPNWEIPKEQLKAMREQAKRPNVRIGMTKDQVINHSNWGKPDDIHRTITEYGSHEQWIYNGYNYRNKYLYFKNGKVTTIQD